MYGYVNGKGARNRDEYVFMVRGFGPIETDEELMAFSEKASHNWFEAGWRRSFIAYYLSDYALDEPKRSLTDKEYARLKEIQSAMRAERDAFDSARYERYEAGTATREDMVWLLDAEIEKEANHWGADNFWTNMAREHKAKVLAAYDSGGDPVDVAKIDSWYESGQDFEKWLRTDGSVRTYVFGAD